MQNIKSLIQVKPSALFAIVIITVFSCSAEATVEQREYTCKAYSYSDSHKKIMLNLSYPYNQKTKTKIKEIGKWFEINFFYTPEQTYKYLKIYSPQGKLGGFLSGDGSIQFEYIKTLDPDREHPYWTDLYSNEDGTFMANQSKPHWLAKAPGGDFDFRLKYKDIHVKYSCIPKI